MLNYVNSYRFKPPTLTAVCDPYYDKILLLLEMSGASGTTTFTDTGPWARSVTRTGSVAISSLYGVTNSVSAIFDGNNDYLSTSLHDATAISTKDFTIEMWVNRAGDTATGSANQSTLLDLRTSDPAIQINLNIYGSTTVNANKVTFYVNGLDRIISDTALAVGTWYHLALVRTAGRTVMYIDGVAQTMTYVDTNNYNSTTVRIGGRYAAISSDFRSFNGYIDSIRITDISRYNNYTMAVQSQEYSNTDVYWANVVLLMNMNGANTSTTFTEQTGKTVTVVGNTNLRTNLYKFGTASAYFDGSGDYLTGPTSSDWAFGTGDFTIEMWFYPVNTNVFGIDTRANTPADSNGLGLGARAGLPGDAISFYIYPTAYFFTDLDPQMNQWNHVIWQRRSGVLNAYLNGKLSSISYNISTNFTSNWLTIGTNINNRINSSVQSQAWSQGYIDELRITKGIARYSVNVTVDPNEIAFPVTDCTNSLSNANINQTPISTYQTSEMIWSYNNNQTNIGMYQTSEVIWSYASNNQPDIGVYQTSEIIWSYATNNQPDIGLYQPTEIVYSQTVNSAPISLLMNETYSIMAGTNPGSVPATAFTGEVLYAESSTTIPILASG